MKPQNFHFLRSQNHQIAKIAFFEVTAMKYEFLYSLYTRIGCDRISQRAAQGSLYRGAGRQRRSERLPMDRLWESRGSYCRGAHHPVINHLRERARHVRATTAKGLVVMRQVLFPHRAVRRPGGSPCASFCAIMISYANMTLFYRKVGNLHDPIKITFWFYF